MIRDLKIRHHRLPVALHLHIFTVVFSDRHAGIDDIGNRHHDLRDLLIARLFLLFQLGQMRRKLRDFFLGFFCFFLLTLSHQTADLF